MNKVRNRNGMKALNIFSNLKIGWKYGIALGLTLVLFCISGVSIYVQVEQANDDLDALEGRGDRALLISEMASLFRTKDIRISNYVTFQRESDIKEFEQKSKQFEELLTRIEPEMDTVQQRKLFRTIEQNNILVNDLFLKGIVPAITIGDEEKTLTVRGTTEELRSNTVDNLTKLIEITQSERQIAIQQAKESLKDSIMFLVVSILVSIILGTFITIFVSRMVSKNLNAVVHMTSEIANGNLKAKPLVYSGKDEIGILVKATNTMQENLQVMLLKVSTVSQEVSSQSEELTQTSSEVQLGSSQVASTMQELSSGAVSQADSATKLSEMMADFVQKLQVASVHSDTISESSRSVLTLTNKGGQQMQHSVDKMERINTIVKESVQKVQGLDNQTKEISKLVKVIHDIAEQTNLLALNAAIEAARAGEHGRGFAVVADEVRKLAEQVSHSITDITGIVENIQSESSGVAESLKNGYNEVEEGTVQIQDTGETFNDIAKSITGMVDSIQDISQHLTVIAENSNDMNKTIEEVAAISEESAAGIEETTASVQQTNASMEEIAGSANQLAQLAEELNGQIRKFNV